MSHYSRKKPGFRWGPLIATLVILGVVFGGGYLAFNTLWGSYGNAILERFGKLDNDYEGAGTGEVFITIYEGEMGSDIAETLAEADVVKTADVFYKLLLKKPEAQFYPGSYKMRLQMSAEEAFKALSDPNNRVERAAAIREGLTVEQTFEILAAGTGIPVDDFHEAAKDVQGFGVPQGIDSLEGWLFPANYEFELDDDAKSILQKMVDLQWQNLRDLGMTEKGAQEILTVASIIQKEAGTIDDFTKVSRVIYNRLDIGMLLQMDSTAQYGVGEHENGNVWSSDEALTSENPWNTYVHAGLPQGPIANPGRDAIAAAVNPAEGDWIFFVVAPGGTGASTFTSNQQDHDIAVQEYRNWCESTPDSGC